MTTPAPPVDDARVTLLPCPFCGAEAKRIDIEDGENAGGSCISCTACMASSNVEFEFKENFVSNWNRRAPSPTADEAGRLAKYALHFAWVLENPSAAPLSHPGLIKLLRDVAALLSRIPSEEATAQYIDGILESYDQTTLANDVCGDELIERLAQDGYRITRAPGAGT